MDAADIDRAIADLWRMLAPHVERDWQVTAGDLESSCWQTAAHIAHDLIAYAGQVAHGPAADYLPIDLTVRAGTEPLQLLHTVAACGEVLSACVAQAPSGARGWHWGPTDPGGFAALGVEEILVHAHDITQGLGLPWTPSSELCAGVLARLFPDAPPGVPHRVLLWCTGRIALDDRPRVSSWVLKAALPA